MIRRIAITCVVLVERRGEVYAFGRRERFSVPGFFRSSNFSVDIRLLSKKKKNLI
jgi:hypothetical protein